MCAGEQREEDSKAPHDVQPSAVATERREEEAPEEHVEPTRAPVQQEAAPERREEAPERREEVPAEAPLKRLPQKREEAAETETGAACPSRSCYALTPRHCLARPPPPHTPRARHTQVPHWACLPCHAPGLQFG